jgi:hypothetical protein
MFLLDNANQYFKIALVIVFCVFTQAAGKTIKLDLPQVIVEEQSASQQAPKTNVPVAISQAVEPQLASFAQLLQLRAKASHLKFIQGKLDCLNKELLNLQQRLKTCRSQAITEKLNHEYAVKLHFAQMLFDKYKPQYPQLVAVDVRSTMQKIVANLPKILLGSAAAITVIWSLGRLDQRYNAYLKTKKAQEEQRIKAERLRAILEAEKLEKQRLTVEISAAEEMLAPAKIKLTAKLAELGITDPIPQELALVILPLLQNLRRDQQIELCKRFVNGGSCAICAANWHFKDDVGTIQVTPCLHVYHQACLNTWLDKNNSCPECRKPVTRGPVMHRYHYGASGHFPFYY